MFRGLQPIRSQIIPGNTVSQSGVSHGSRASKLQFFRTNTTMAAANGAAGATAKTLKLENARGLLHLKDRG